MAFADLTDRINASVLRVFAEPVIIAGDREVAGVLETAPAAGGLGSEVGLTMRMSQQVAAVLWLSPEHAEGVAERAIVSARGVSYLVTRRDEQDALVRLELVADTADEGSPPDGERWR